MTFSESKEGFWCPQHADGVRSDEDGCCSMCGAMLITPAVFETIQRSGFSLGTEAAAKVLDDVVLLALDDDYDRDGIRRKSFKWQAKIIRALRYEDVKGEKDG